MTQVLGRPSRTRVAGPADVHALAVILVAIGLAVGTALPQLGPGRSVFPSPSDVELSDRLASGRAAMGARGMGPRADANLAISKPSLVTPLDVNTAKADDLQALPGIGPTLAERIVAHRDTYGPFQTPEELLQVPGIGPKRWERIRPLVRVTGGQ